MGPMQRQSLQPAGQRTRARTALHTRTRTALIRAQVRARLMQRQLQQLAPQQEGREVAETAVRVDLSQ